MAENTPLLHPVIAKAPAEVRRLHRRELSEALSLCAREALVVSARLSGLKLGELVKGDRGEPLPSGGVYWSLSHTKEYVAAVAATARVGVDIERIRPFSKVLQEQIAEAAEWALAPVVDDALCTRFWTAKEAVLKAIGIGLGGLSRCTVTAIIDERHVRLQYESETWIVSQFFGIRGNIAAVSAAADGVEWHLKRDSIT